VATVHILELGVDGLPERAARTMKRQPKDIGDPLSWYRCACNTFKGTVWGDYLLRGYTKVTITEEDIRFRCVADPWVVVIDRKRTMLTA